MKKTGYLSELVQLNLMKKNNLFYAQANHHEQTF